MFLNEKYQKVLPWRCRCQVWPLASTLFKSALLSSSLPPIPSTPPTLSISMFFLGRIFFPTPSLVCKLDVSSSTPTRTWIGTAGSGKESTLSKSPNSINSSTITKTTLSRNSTTSSPLRTRECLMQFWGNWKKSQQISVKSSRCPD